jgi:hypothetical protein
MNGLKLVTSLVDWLLLRCGVALQAVRAPCTIKLFTLALTRIKTVRVSLTTLYASD